MMEEEVPYDIPQRREPLFLQILLGLIVLPIVFPDIYHDGKFSLARREDETNMYP